MDQVFDQIQEDRMFYENSSGGVTVSGGEALLQPEFVHNLFAKCKAIGIHTVLDTAGNVPWSSIDMVLDYVDLVLYDIKHMDSKKHKKGTGAGNELILSNAARISKCVKTWFRVPLIPNYNDSKSNITALAEFALEVNVDKISFLPYHELGVTKYSKLGLVYPMKGTSSPNEQIIDNVKQTIQFFPLNVSIGR